MKKILLSLMFLGLCSALVSAQDQDTLCKQSRCQEKDSSYIPAKGMYIGLSGGVSFGTCTFRSFSDNGKTAGFTGSLEVGYRFSPLFALGIDITLGNVKTTSMNCCDYWLSEDGQRFTNAKPVHSTDMHYYDITSCALVGKYLLSPSFNLLSLCHSERWSFDLTPQIGAVQSGVILKGTNASGDYTEWKKGVIWNFGYGGEASVGFAFARHFDARLFGGVTFLAGKRFDAIPEHVHTENLLYQGGLKIRWYL